MGTLPVNVFAGCAFPKGSKRRKSFGMNMCFNCLTGNFNQFPVAV
jgi:hypothetical protein